MVANVLTVGTVHREGVRSLEESHPESRMMNNSAQRGSLLLPILALAACADGPTTPSPPVEIEVLTPVQWSGSKVEIRSESFRDIASVRVAVASDTVSAEATSEPDVRRFELPALPSGAHEADVLLDRRTASIRVRAVGVARDPTFVAGSVLGRPLFSVQPTGAGSVLLSDDSGRDFGPGERPGYGLVNLIAGTRVTRIPQLSPVDPLEVKFSVPGPSYRLNHFVFDMSAPGSADVRVWRTRPDVAAVATLPCGHDQSAFPYAVAEVDDGICLEIRRGEIWRNGTDFVLEDPAFSFGHAQFRMARGGAWTVLLTSRLTGREPIEKWPVFGGQGEVAYELSRYGVVTGAAFSTDASTMWVAARLRGGEWRLDALAAATGEVLRSLSFEDGSHLLDVLKDPLDDRLYLVSTRSFTDPPVLHHVVASTLDLVRSIPAPNYGFCFWSGERGVLDPGGSDGRIHFLTNAGADCGWLLWSFDRTSP